MNLTDINTVKKILSRHGFSFSKALGQNFIINPDVCPEMARLSGIEPGCGVIEIGPGIGVLTVELAKIAEKVVAIELDTRLIPVLAQTLSDYRNVEVINADVLKTDLVDIINTHFAGKKVYICANLPYYITSPIIMYLLESRLPVESITVMVQKEAAERLCAPVGSRESGAITVAVNYYAKAKRLFGVDKNSFTPAPKVDSEVMRLDIRKEPEIQLDDEKFFFSVVKAAFSQRRKTAINGISSGMGIAKDKITKALEECNLSPTVRAEALSMEQLASLANCLYKLKQEK
ncbi:MAG: 16S rRNA (adenine(1518)-N(6)/adenine(1519)-N(6))-dimethyltransferase RsmA [Clostridia bacterium]|nr:16S rRNA (adenine(1518)-N(6)/adenine(1519)-N(6))-dimethyltransferase RsmA [Clostridia bacterium]MBR3974274.1 16S rRNA (adenine(1518)-N(6)/adenine(1519)-N(6))-dimethyltransferase RsmA [Clostridia bacterium]